MRFQEEGSGGGGETTSGDGSGTASGGESGSGWGESPGTSSDGGGGKNVVVTGSVIKEIENSISITFRDIINSLFGR